MDNFFVANDNNQNKQNFLARIMGIFGEKIAGYWFENGKSCYDNLGRPTIHWTDNGKKKRVTLDFLINKKESDEIYLVEQKNFFAYQKGKLRTIKDNCGFTDAYHKWSKSKLNQPSGAWKIFNDLPKDFTIKTKNSKYENHHITGTVLIWSDVDESYKNKFCKKYGFSDIIGLTKMIHDLNKWEDKNYYDFIYEKEEWLQELFNWLLVKS